MTQPAPKVTESLDELLKQQAALEAKLAIKLKEEKENAIAHIKELVKKFNLTDKHIFGYYKPEKAKKEPKAPKAEKPKTEKPAAGAQK